MLSISRNPSFQTATPVIQAQQAVCRVGPRFRNLFICNHCITISTQLRRTSRPISRRERSTHSHNTNAQRDRASPSVQVNRGNSPLFPERRKSTDKCGRDGHRKLIRISAHAPRPENSYVIAESRPTRRSMKKVSSGCCVNRTFYGDAVLRAGFRMHVLGSRV